jgi:Family of unknown function (DUF6496)
VKHRSTPRRNISAKSIVSPRRLWRATAPPGSPKPHESARRPKRRGERAPNDALISPPHPRRKSDARRTERKTIEKARKAKREGKAPTTQAGEYVRVEIDKIRRGEHGARSPEQAIAIGLSEARRAGVDLPPPKKGKVKESTRKSAEYAYGQHEREPKHQPRVARAVSEVLKKEPQDLRIARGSLASCHESCLAALAFPAIGAQPRKRPKT